MPMMRGMMPPPAVHPRLPGSQGSGFGGMPQPSPMGPPPFGYPGMPGGSFGPGQQVPPPFGSPGGFGPPMPGMIGQAPGGWMGPSMGSMGQGPMQMPGQMGPSYDTSLIGLGGSLGQQQQPSMQSMWPGVNFGQGAQSAIGQLGSAMQQLPGMGQMQPYYGGGNQQ